MRPCIYFKQKASDDPFEGARLRKTIKGALELQGIAYVDSLHAPSDFLHVLSPRGEEEILEERKEGKKVIVSAFYAEDDASCSFLAKDVDGEPLGRIKGLKLLENADLILVPDAKTIAFLESKEIDKGKVRVLTPGVNLARFENNDPLEANLFKTYFRFDEEKYLLTIADLKAKNTQKYLESVAKALPNWKIFCLGTDGKGRPSPSTLRRLSKRAPKNLVYSGIVDDDVYRAGLMGASGYLSFGPYHFDFMSVLEAHAAKVPVYGVEGVPDEASLEANDPETLVSLLAKDNQETIIEGYRLAKRNSIKELGAELQSIYAALLGK